MRTIHALLALSIVAVAADAADAADKSVVLKAGAVRTIAFQRPIDTLYVANPAIASATAYDSTHIVLAGKRGGNTTVVAVDMQGNIIATTEVTVHSKAGHVATSLDTITLIRGTEQIVYSCNSGGCMETRRSGSGAKQKAPSAMFPTAPIAAPNFAPVMQAMPIGIMAGG